MATWDVTVRGAGIFGLSIAFACARRGARVQVIDPAGVGAGSSGGIVGALAPHVPENWNPKKAFQLDSLLRAEAFWSDVAATGGADPGYARTGRLQPLEDDRAVDLARARSTTAASLWQGRADWRVTDRPDTAFLPPSPTGLWVHDTLSAHLHPRRAVAALAAALAALGARIGAEGDDTGKVIWATGWQGLDALSAQHHRAVGTGVKGQAALFDADFRGAPQLFVQTLHIIPHTDGTVAVGSTTEADFTDPQATDAALDALIARARAVLPHLADARVTERWAGVRPRSRSRAPMLGAHPFRPGDYVANGGFKIGFGMAPKVAEVMADLVLEGVDRIPDGFGVGDNL